MQNAKQQYETNENKYVRIISHAKRIKEPWSDYFIFRVVKKICDVIGFCCGVKSLNNISHC